MKRIIAITIFLTALLLSGCNGTVFAALAPTATETATPLPPAMTASVTPTPSITPTFTPAPTATPTWVVQGPDHVMVPILMYHHVTAVPIGNGCVLNPDPLCVPPDKFDAELKLLRDWGYTTITTSMLVDAITNGASLPPHPFMITFDDGNLDNYTNAFPIMKKYGFTGVLYIVVNYIGQPNYLNVDQIKEMAAAGWEVGSHSETHQDLLANPDNMRTEIVQSRKDLEDRLGVPILTFAYPFGSTNSSAIDYAHFAGYIAAMGASGFTADQWTSNLFVLQRCQIKGSDDAKTFIRFLPWHGDPSYLPTDTPTPTATATRTPKPTWTP